MIPPRFAWMAGMAGKGIQAAKPWMKGIGGALGVGGIAGMINPDRSTLSGIGTTFSGAFSGGMTGSMVGMLGGAGYEAYHSGGANLLTKQFGATALKGAQKYGKYGLFAGLAAGTAFGILKSGITSNKPVNRIRGLHQ